MNALDGQKEAGLLLNFAPIDLNGIQVEVSFLPFEDSNRMRTIRRQYFGSHVLLRRQNRVACVATSTNSQVLGEGHLLMPLAEDLGLAGALVRDAILQELHRLGRTLHHFDPVTFVARGNSDDFLTSCLPDHLKERARGLSVRPQYQFWTRALHPDKQASIFGLAGDVKSAFRIEASCTELIQFGVPLLGRYVEIHQDPQDPRMAPRRRLAGRIESIEGSDACLSDTGPGPTLVSLDRLYLEATLDNFQSCLRYCLGSHFEHVLAKLQLKMGQLGTGPEKLSRLRAAVSYFSKRGLQVTPGVVLYPGKLAKQGDPNFPVIDKAPKPVYIFDPSGSRTCHQQDRGIEAHGPYDRVTFSPKKPKVTVVCERSSKGQMEQFVHRLLEGMPNTKLASGFAPYPKGLLRKYNLDDWELSFFPMDSDTTEGYSSSIQKAIETATDGDFRWSLALVQTKNSHRQAPVGEDPYWIAKGAFMTHGIAVQEIRTETISLPDGQLGFVLKNLALACYAKMGGIPWVLRASPAIAHELIFGLGSASIGEGRRSTRERIVGITTVFSGDGQYILENRSRAVPYETYSSEVLSSLRETLTRVQQEFNWQPGDSVRLIFHAFKPLRDAEVEAVRALISELGKYDVEYAFVHVVENHPFLLFDLDQQDKKGRLVAERGQYLRLADYETLLCCTGPRELKQADDGIPRPLLLRLQRNSTFKDMTYLARQVFFLTAHSWRGFLPTPMPVTVLYSQWIAHHLGHLSRLPRWNSESMLGKIGRTRWFL